VIMQFPGAHVPREAHDHCGAGWLPGGGVFVVVRVIVRL
jgi:hypothetical protein